MQPVIGWQARRASRERAPPNKKEPAVMVAATAAVRDRLERYFGGQSLFEITPDTPAVGSQVSLSKTVEHNEIEAILAEGIDPRFMSETTGAERYRTEFQTGAWMMGMLDNGKTLKPQQWKLAEVCNAYDDAAERPLHKFISTLMPRRSAKSTSLLALALGRCYHRPGYLVGYTVCTTGLKARDRFHKDIRPPLERILRAWDDEHGKESRPFEIRKSGGSERIEFANGSILQVLPPEGDKFRSDAYDMIILDEAGEATPEMGADLLDGCLATLDTRPHGQFIIAGTAGDYREGNLLWDALEDGRQGLLRTGIIEYSAPDHTSDAELAAWEPTDEHPHGNVKQLVLDSHPGIGTLTTLDDIELNHHKRPAATAREYLGIFGIAGAVGGLVDVEKFGHLKIDTPMPPRPPAKAVFGIAVHPNQKSAAIVAAWRAKGKARLLVVDHRPGTQWLAEKAGKLSRKYSLPIAHDSNGPVLVEVDLLARQRPKPRLLKQSFGDVKTSAALIVKEIELGNVEHWGQESLNEAARLATKRRVGPQAWAIGRGDEDDDVIVLEALSFALREYDARRNLPSLGVMVA